MGPFRSMIILLAVMISTTARAVEDVKIKLAERWSVVGVIAQSDATTPTGGVAVLRNNNTKRTYTLAVGDSLPMEFGFVLQKIQRRDVVVANGKDSVLLGYAETPVTEEAPTESRTSRFLESYYRGLDGHPVEVLERDDSDANSSSPSSFGLGRLGGSTDRGDHSRLDFYRHDRTYRVGGEDPDPESNFTVSYDNFTDSDDDDSGDNIGDGASSGSYRAGPLTYGYPRTVSKTVPTTDTYSGDTGLTDSTPLE